MLLPILFLFKTKISDYFKYSKNEYRNIFFFLYFMYNKHIKKEE